MSTTTTPYLPLLYTETKPQISIPNLPPRTLSAFIASYQSTIQDTSTPSTPSTITSSSSYSSLPNTNTNTNTNTNISTPRSSTTTTTTPIQIQTETSTTKSLSYTLTTTTNMPFRRSNNPKMVETRTTKPTLLTRLRGRNAKTRTTKTTTKIEPATRSNANTTRTHRSGWGNRTRKTNNSTTNNSTTTTGLLHHRQNRRRHATIGDKISGAMMKLKGSLTRRPGVKAAGTRRMHGTGEKGSHRAF